MRVRLIASTKIEDIIPGYIPHEGWEDLATPDGDELAEMGGRLCYESWSRPNPKTATNEGYLKNIIDQGHFSVLEHASATFYIDGVSRNLTHELIRHRHLSFSEVSQRYVDVGGYKEIAAPAMKEAYGFHDEPLDSLTVRQYDARVNDLMLRGLSRKEARQAARYILPGGLETKILVTGNMRAWREMLSKRLSEGADLEIRLMSQKIRDELLKLSPSTFQDFLPKES